MVRKVIKWLRRLLTRCERCGGFNGSTYRQNTKYVDDALNIVTLCPLCKQENDEYWADMWRDYYSGTL